MRKKHSLKTMCVLFIWETIITFYRDLICDAIQAYKHFKWLQHKK